MFKSNSYYYKEEHLTQIDGLNQFDLIRLSPFVRGVDSAILSINRYPVDNPARFVNSYLLGSDWPVG